MKLLGRKKQKHTTQKQDHLVVVTPDSSFHVQEAYKAARTNVMFSLVDPRCKKVVVTSSLPSEGKTTTCANMAITFAQTGLKVLAIDADMRRPTLHRKLDVLNTNGLSNLLGRFCTLEEAILTTQYENLDVITSGYLPPNPAELLASPAMTELLMLLEHKYDYIFIDTPPVHVVTDATVLSDRVSGTIVVVRHEVTRHKELQETLDKLALAQAKVLGFILHDVKTNKKGRKAYEKYNYYEHKSTSKPQNEQRIGG